MSIPIWDQFISLIMLALTTINMLIGNHPAIAIIILTAVIKGIMFPLTMKQLHSSKEMQLIQPKIKELQKKYGKDKQTLTQETMKLYKEHGVNPAAGCLPMLVQLPVFFALYGAILNLSKTTFGVPFLWLPSLAHPDPFFILPVLAMVTQFIQQRMMMPAGAPRDSQTQMTNSMMQFMPIMILIFAWNFSSGAVIYWVTSTVFSIVQQYFVTGWGSLFELPLLRRVAPASATAA
ncbi:MAG: YidC/Oxa1 family membrane protein insertase, partial [Chloroflexi bacterium]|nr:YidC/Oxa1 family membrane protein insertase [Chloroflexota bacterium]